MMNVKVCREGRKKESPPPGSTPLGADGVYDYGASVIPHLIARYEFSAAISAVDIVALTTTTSAISDPDGISVELI